MHTELSPSDTRPASGSNDPLAVHQIVALGVAILAVFLLSLYKIENYDVWWHLKTGEHILRTHTIPRGDIFSLTAAQRYWVNPSWLADVALFLVHRLVGLGGLVVLKALLVAGTMALLFLVMRRHGAELYTGLAVLVLAALVGRGRFVVRPLLATPLLFVVFCALLAPGRRPTVWHFVAMSGLMALWTNLHAGFVAGCILVAIRTFCESVNALRTGRAEERRGPLPFIGLAAVTCAATAKGARAPT